MLFVTHCFRHKNKNMFISNLDRRNTTEAVKTCFYTGMVNTSCYRMLHSFPHTPLRCFLWRQSRYLIARSHIALRVGKLVGLCQCTRLLVLMWKDDVSESMRVLKNERNTIPGCRKHGNLKSKVNNFEKHWKLFWGVPRKYYQNFQKEIRKIILRFMMENFENYFTKFWNILENFENYSEKF